MAVPSVGKPGPREERSPPIIPCVSLARQSRRDSVARSKPIVYYHYRLAGFSTISAPARATDMRLFSALSLAAILALPAAAETRTVRINSKILGDERVLHVNLPPSYAVARQRYAVVYLLDGHVQQFFDVTVAAAGYDIIPDVHDYAMPPQIVVGVDQRDRGTDLGRNQELTIATQLTAELLGVDVSQVDVVLGDTDMPPAPQSGGSGLAISLSGAIENAAANLREKLGDLGNGTAGERSVDILVRNNLDELSADGEVTPHPDLATVAPSPAFAAQFAEVHVDADLGLVRVARIVSAVDGGRILNEKLARSQIAGSVVMGIGMALLEATVFDATGRVANGTFGDYLIPVNAASPDLDT